MWGTITGLYIVCLAIGFIYALVGAIFGELGSHGDVAIGDHGIELGGHDVDIGGHDIDVGDHGVEIGGHHADLSSADVSVSPLNGLTIATFIGSFGAMGLIFQWGLGLEAWPSLALAIPSAVIAATAQFLLYVKLLVGSTASSEATTEDILNCIAEVITPIPENGTGEITYAIKGFRYTSPARSVEGSEVPRGSRVRIIRCAAGVMQVREF